VDSFFFLNYYFQTRRNEVCDLYDMAEAKAIYFIFWLQDALFPFYVTIHLLVLV